MNDPLVLIVGFVAATIIGSIGVRISYYKQYQLIPSYREATPTQKKLFDIEGLSKHVGDGLSTVAVFIVIASLLLYFELMVWFFIASIFAVLIISIIIIGRTKFMPVRRRLSTESPHDEKHYFLYKLLPEPWFRNIEAGTHQWEQVCSKCSLAQDFWEAGGVRYKAVGEPFMLGYCEACEAMYMHRVRRKDRR